ncbi:MAG TPA: lipocalin family protein [Steroidobacteraceae bacterium]|nr:lipocalin family protein [Steroidobacteraceae bacterium]
MRALQTLFIPFILLLQACSTMNNVPLKTVEHVDLQRFMGDWYVIANIPTFIEKDAYGAIESYRLNADGTIDTTFTFHKGSFSGKLKRQNPKGFVLDSSNAVWGMRFIWPIKADYRIAYLAPDYSQTIVAREKRDYVWIMARTAKISDEDYNQLIDRAVAMGYDKASIKKVPQQ